MIDKQAKFPEKHIHRYFGIKTELYETYYWFVGDVFVEVLNFSKRGSYLEQKTGLKAEELLVRFQSTKFSFSPTLESIEPINKVLYDTMMSKHLLCFQEYEDWKQELAFIFRELKIKTTIKIQER
jgi:hypothetical protein